MLVIFKFLYEQIARNFGVLLRQGWLPRRSIILGSWDAKEYGMVKPQQYLES